jgi:hypothetical protein
MNLSGIFYLFSFGCLSALPAVAAECPRPWILFDTGQTLVATPPDYKNMRNMPGMEDYIKALGEENYLLGLVINVPEDWGSEIPVQDPIAKRVIYTQQFFQEGWMPKAAVFPWDPFGKFEGKGSTREFKGRVFFPMKDAERKPAICPSCVLNVALNAAKKAGCAAIFEGEDAEEMKAAEEVGLIPFQVGNTDPSQFYLAPEKIEAYVKNYVPGQWKKGIK